MISHYLDPKNDFAFKKIFGAEKNKEILIHFINDMLSFKEKAPITSVTFLKTIQDPEIAAKKTSIVDILCKDELGNSYIVEMQVAKEDSFVKRAQYYAAKAYSNQVNSGDGYHNLKEVIFLAIADFSMFSDTTEYKSNHVILNIENHKSYLKDFTFTFIELPKFNKSIDQLTDMSEKWAYFFKHAAKTTHEDLEKLIGSDEILARAYQVLDRVSWNETEILTYDQAEKYEGAYQASLRQKINEGIEIGKAEGIEIGKSEGIEIGKSEGIEIGKSEGIEIGMEKNKFHIAQTMLEENCDIKFVAKITGLTIEQISAYCLIKNVQNV